MNKKRTIKEQYGGTAGWAQLVLILVVSCEINQSVLNVIVRCALISLAVDKGGEGGKNSQRCGGIG